MNTVREAKGEPLRIPDLLPPWEILAQLAEECMELGQAALKVRRCLDDLNPTRMSYVEAVAHLNEEWADVLLTIRQLSLIDEGRVYAVMKEKHERWLNSLIEHRRQEEAGDGCV